MPEIKTIAALTSTGGVVTVEWETTGRIDVDWDGKVPPTMIGNEVLERIAQIIRDEFGDYTRISKQGFELFLQTPL